MLVALAWPRRPEMGKEAHLIAVAVAGDEETRDTKGVDSSGLSAATQHAKKLRGSTAGETVVQTHTPLCRAKKASKLFAPARLINF